MEKDLSVINFTNIDSEDFEGMYGGKTTIFKAGATVAFPAFLATHFANHLADKILLKQQKDFGTQETRKPLLDKILGQVIVPFSTPTENIQVEDLPVETATAEPEFPELPKEEEAKVATAFICEVCGKEFKAKIALAGHKRSHK